MAPSWPEHRVSCLDQHLKPAYVETTRPPVRLAETPKDKKEDYSFFLGAFFTSTTLRPTDSTERIVRGGTGKMERGCAYPVGGTA